jgi:16S rRNA (cytosine1402-N4)-methyltransferase
LPLSATVHIPVMLAEVLAALQPVPGQNYADGTLGGGGHTRAIAQAIQPDGYVIAVDRDAGAVSAAEQSLAGCSVKVAHASYRELPAILETAGIPQVHGILLDLGLSSDQLADRTRGFSFESDGELDLRFDVSRGEPAWRWLQRVTETEIADAIFRFGEDRYSRRIARRIVAERERGLKAANEIAQLIRSSVPRTPGERIDPATRTFQALRIVVNRELEELEKALSVLPNCLLPGGRLAIISFHSLEDRIVKHALREDARLQTLTKKPILPSDTEIDTNPRSRSAKLRVAQRL